jgi:hypothetical protein
MTDQQLSLIVTLLQDTPQLACFLGWYLRDARRYRVVVYYANQLGATFGQWALEY